MYNYPSELARDTNSKQGQYVSFTANCIQLNILRYISSVCLWFSVYSTIFSNKTGHCDISEIVELMLLKLIYFLTIFIQSVLDQIRKLANACLCGESEGSTSSSVFVHVREPHWRQSIVGENYSLTSIQIQCIDKQIDTEYARDHIIFLIQAQVVCLHNARYSRNASYTLNQISLFFY